MKLCELGIKLQCPEECSFVLSRLPTDKEPASIMQRCLVKALLQIKDLKESDTSIVCVLAPHFLFV